MERHTVPIIKSSLIANDIVSLDLHGGALSVMSQVVQMGYGYTDSENLVGRSL